MKDIRFSELGQQWLNGLLNDEEREELQEILRESPERRGQFVRLAQADAALRDLGEKGGTVPWQSPATAARRSVSLVSVSWFSAAAAVAVGALVAILLTRGGEDEAMGQGHAILTRSAGVVWDGVAFETGDILPEGVVKLKKGLAQIEFFGGATLIVEGPGELEIRSASEAFCRSGRLRASVPPAARGFTIETPEGRVVDLGTEFGLSVGPDGAPEVHVFDGKVEWHGMEGPVREILDGQAVAGERDFAADRTLFTSAADLDSHVAESNDSRFARWRAYSRDLRRDPRLLAYFPMDQPGNWQRRLLNEAPTGPEIDGAIVGANRVTGRWEDVGKSAVEFTPTGSRVRVAIPGEFESLTFACWVRVESLDRLYNALYLTDSYQPGECHWQLQEDGRILFSFLHSERNNFMSRSPVVWDISRSGQWMHLAAVLDLEKQVVRHYADGKMIFEHEIGPKYRISRSRLGHGEIGNWGLPNSPEKDWFAIRNLNGRIDEFAIFAGALTGDEIARMHEIGNPH